MVDERPSGRTVRSPIRGVEILAVRISAEENRMALLNREERERADRFRSSGARTEFIAVRAALRTRLGDVLGISPQSVPLVRDERGKPRLRAGGPAFNVSHTRGLGLIALCPDREVGVDVERIELTRPTMELEPHVLTDVEQAALRSLPRESRVRGFFAQWVCKEAVVKATGAGIGASLSSVQVGEAVLRGRPRLISVRRSGAGPLAVGLLDVGDRYAAAVAATESPVSIG